MERFKFGYLTAAGDVEYHYPDAYAWERTTGPARLVVGPRAAHVELLAELAACWRGPFWLLYVLTVPRAGAEAGRYQTAEPLSLAALRAFLARYRAFLEGDARHALWVASASGEGQLVYDRHNLIYAYGPLEQFEDVLAARGIRPGAVEIPVPHSHHYHPDFDGAELALLGAMAWLQKPLREGDED